MLRRLRIENLVLIREAELTFGPGLNAVTGETGAGKTIFAQAIGLLLGARADASAVGADGTEAYVEAELDVPDGFFDDDGLVALAELRPEDEPGLVLARRVFGDGRTRAYAWGRAVAREDVAAAAERLIAMSGQFEQRRLGRPSFQLDVLDAFCGAEQLERRSEARLAWRGLLAARRRYEELTRDADAAAFRLAELQALVEATEGMAPGDEQALLARRERLRNLEELADASILIYRKHLQAWGIYAGSDFDIDAAVDAVKRQLITWGAAADGFVVRDGSGLSRLNVVSAETLVRVLRRMRQDTAYATLPPAMTAAQTPAGERKGVETAPDSTAPILAALPVAGVDGTLGRRLGGGPTRGNVRAKTGSLEQVRALSGYVTTADGRQLAFAVLCNNWTVSAETVETAIDEIVLRLARLRRPGR